MSCDEGVIIAVKRLELAYLQLKASLSAQVSDQQGCRQAQQASRRRFRLGTSCHSPRSNPCDTWVARGGKCRVQTETVKKSFL
jgi:hypothetical protein